MNFTEKAWTDAPAAEITVPNDYVFRANPVSYELTDYAYDLGARAVDSYRDAQGNDHFIGETWVSGTEGHQLDALTFWDTYALPHNQVFIREVRASGDGQVGVAPCFVNPEALGMATQVIDGEEYLTIFNRLSNYPHERIRDNNLCYALTAHKAAVDAQENAVSDVYALPRYQRDSGSAKGRVGCLPVCCYEYQGQSYVYAHKKWYKCGPIRVTRQADGNLQCSNLLFAAPRGEGRGNHSLYSFLNGQFLADLVKHSRAKLSHLTIGTTAEQVPTREQ